MPLWNDTNGFITTNADLVRNNMVSVASVLSPYEVPFNQCVFVGEMAMGHSDSHILDSIQILGYYGCNPAKSSVVDTLHLVFLYSEYGPITTHNIWAQFIDHSHYGKITSPNLSYDSLNNRGQPKTIAQYQDVLLYSTDSGLFTKIIPLMAPDGTTPAPISLAASTLIGVTITFKSGDTAATISGPLSTPVPGDTLISDVPPYYKYNMFMPYIDYYTQTPPGGSLHPPAYPFYSVADQNTGCFKTLPDSAAGWRARYIPHWAFQDTLPSYLQYPVINWHIECATCDIRVICFPGITNEVLHGTAINVYPNPATDELDFNYSTPLSSDVSVTLINMLGQVVLTKQQTGRSSERIILNTLALPAGMYIYKVQANGEQSTGKVLIEH